MTPSWRKLLCSLLVVLATTEQFTNVAAAPLEPTPPIEARAVKPHVNAAMILAAAAAAVTPGYGRLGHMARRDQQDDDAWTTRSPYEQEQHLDVRAAVKPHVNAAQILAAAAAAVTPGYGRFGHMAKREGELKHFPAVRKKKHGEDQTEQESESEDESESETSKAEDKTKSKKTKSKTSSKASKTKTKSKKTKTSTHHSKATKSGRDDDDDDDDELVKRGGLSNFPTVAKLSTRGIAARSTPRVKRRSVCSAKKVSSTSTSSTTAKTSSTSSTAKTTSTSSTAKTSSTSTTAKISSTSKPVSTSTASSTTSKSSSTSTASTATSKSRSSSSSSTASKASSTTIASTSSSTSSKSSSSTASSTSTKASTSSSTKASSTSTASKTSTTTASTATATYGTTEASTDMAKIMAWAGATDMMNSTQKTETIAALLSAADRYFPELSRKDAVRYLLADINAESSFNVTAYNGGREDSGESLGLMQVSPSSGAQELPLFMGHNRVSYNNYSWSNTPGPAGPLLDYATGQQLVLSTLSRDDLFRPWVAIHLGSWIQSNLGRTASTDPYGWAAISAAQYALLAAQNASTTANATGTASQQSTAATKLQSAQAASDSALVGAGLSRSVLTGLGSWVAGPAVDGDSSYTGSGDDVSAAYFSNIMAGVRVLYGNSSMTTDFLNGLVLTAGLVDYR